MQLSLICYNYTDYMQACVVNCVLVEGPVGIACKIIASAITEDINQVHHMVTVKAIFSFTAVSKE